MGIAINCTKEAPKILDCKIYPLSLGEQEKLDEYIKENLEKGYIRPSKSQYSSLFFFVGKKDGKLRPVVDYRKLNSFTIPDRYPLPLIPELVDKVRNVQLFTKMDIQYVQDTTTYGSGKGMKQRQLSRQTRGYMNQQSCPLGSETHQQSSRDRKSVV